MADATLISASTLSISPAVSLTQTDISASCCDGYLVDAPSNDRSLKEELRSGSCIDSINWVPPEPEDHQEDDVDDLRCREEGWSWSSRFETEMSKKQFDAIYLYFKREIEYYLKSVGISCSGNDRDVWADIVTMLSMEAALRMPEYSFRGNSGDPNVYVKVKCIATGSCKQSGVFKGLVFNKHAAHEDVPTEYKNPLLLLDKKRENCLKEMIKLCNPNVILVEKTLSPDIQEILHAKRMTLVMELKQHHRRKIALCTRRADFFSSKLRQCHSLYFINIVEEHAPLCADGKRPTKRLMFLRGTRGVTILLKGSHIDELKKIKRVVKLAVFKINHYTRDILASSRTGRMIISKCNTDFMKHKDDITAVLGLARYSVLISRCNAKKGNACLSDINLYRNFDMPLQMFMCEDLFNQELLCGTCNELPEAHISFYVHRHKKITVKVNRLPFDKYLPGENEGKLWMWSFCGQCKPPNESLKRVLVPVAARSVSFGMILDHALSKNYLWDIPLHCEHFFYGDYLHFYGLGSMVVMFKCSSVPTYSVSLPPTKIKPCGSFEGDLLNDQKNSSDHEDGFSSWVANVLAILKDQKKSLDDPNEDVKPYQYVQKMFTLSSPKLWCFNFGNSHDSKGNLHPEISLGRYSVACLFHNEFVELRSQCGLSEPDYISSLSRSTPWDAKGGKSKSFFAKTLDDRFIIKEIKKVEFCAFHEFALVYFAHMKDCFKKRQNSLLAKTLGVYKLTKKKSGKKYDVIVMENITYGRKITRLYDLKGALYGRFNPATNGEGNVLWDQNFLDDMKHSLFEVDTIGVWELQHPIRNDTSFLESSNVMDYSLLVGVDTEKKEIVCGIIDYLRRYTWEKILESWFKSNFIVPKNHLPTVLPSQQYTNRFIKFILDSISDPLVSKRLLEEYKKVVHEQPTAAMSSTSILNGGEIWKKTFEAHLQSPYKNRIVDVKKRANEDEEIICEWLFSSKGGKRDEVFRTKNGKVTTRKVMKSLHPKCYIGANVLDSWV